MSEGTAKAARFRFRGHTTSGGELKSEEVAWLPEAAADDPPAYRFALRGPKGSEQKVAIIALVPEGETRHIHLVIEGAAGGSYKLEAGGKTFEGRVSRAGVLDQVVPKGTGPAVLTLTVGGAEQSYQLQFGEMPPVTEPAGVQARLNALGFIAGASGKLDDDTGAALKEFQEQYGLEATGKLNDETRKQLEAAYSGG